MKVGEKNDMRIKYNEGDNFSIATDTTVRGQPNSNSLKLFYFHSVKLGTIRHIFNLNYAKCDDPTGIN